MKDFIDRFVASRSHSSTGPPFTYHSGGTVSTTSGQPVTFYVHVRVFVIILQMFWVTFLSLHYTSSVLFCDRKLVLYCKDQLGESHFHRLYPCIYIQEQPTSPHCWISLVIISPDWIMKSVACVKPRAGLPPPPYPISHTTRKHVTSTTTNN